MVTSSEAEYLRRIVLPQVNVLGSYEDGDVQYYVCDILYQTFHTHKTVL